MTYEAPQGDIRFVLQHLCGLEDITALPCFAEATPDMVEAILEEAGKYAGQVLSPLNRVGDLIGAACEDGKVTTPAEWKDAYGQLAEMGWNSPSSAPERGGMGLPSLVNAAIQEVFHGANMAFQLCPMLTQGAVEAIDAFADDTLKDVFLPKMISGEWTGTMNLTEPQAGSDLAAIRSKAVPDGSTYKITGQKIFITYGDHDLTGNIIHLVLARLPDAPAGVKGISLFLVPKFLLDADGNPGLRNDVRCVSIEHKLGIHGSPTCTLSFGDNGGAVGHLIGAPNRGLEYMFAMMNNARLSVGLQGIGVSEHATQDAARYASDRRQGQARGHEGSAPIMAHPDIRRMLARMRSTTQAARILAYRAAAALDLAHQHPDDAIRQKAQRRVDFLIPVVKGWSTELSVENSSLGVQIHGGMGYVEEIGAAQHYRDARITTIYEGTTGIQALDLVGRKITRDGGAAAGELIEDVRRSARRLAEADPDGQITGEIASRTREAADLMASAVARLLDQGRTAPQFAAANAMTVLQLMGLTLGQWAHCDAACAALGFADTDPQRSRVLRMARFYALQVFPAAHSQFAVLLGDPGAITDLVPEDFQATA